MSLDSVNSGAKRPERRPSVADILAQGLPPEPAAKPASAARPVPPTPATRPVPPTPAQDRPDRHTVQPGETAAAIAKRYGVAMADLRAWNPQIFSDQADGKGRVRRLSGERIYPGDAIMLRPPTPTDRADLKAAAVEHAKKAIERASLQTPTLHNDDRIDELKLLIAKSEEALTHIPADHPDRARCAEMIAEMKAELEGLQPSPKPPAKPEPTAEQKAIAKAKEDLQVLGGQLADTHGRDRAKADQILAQAEAALAKIPADDPDRARCEAMVADLKKLYDGYFPKQPVEDPKIAKQRKELDSYLDQIVNHRPDPEKNDGTPSRWTSVSALVKAQPEVIANATAAQKARIVSMLLGRRSDDLISLIGGGSMNDAAKYATLDVLKAAQAKGELFTVLDTLKAKDQVGDLFSQMSDRTPGVEMAKLFKEAGAYQADRGYYKEMDDDASRALLRANGYQDPPPPTLTSDWLAHLDGPVRKRMLDELASGNQTWEESRMVQWLARQQPEQ